MTEAEAHIRLTEQRRINADLRRAKELRESYGLSFYRPHWKQHRFHEMGEVTGRYCRFGNRTGKTKCGAAEDVAWLVGGRLWYKSSFDILTGVKTETGWTTKVVGHHDGKVDHPLVTQGIPQRGVKGLLVVSSWKKAKEIFTNLSNDWSMNGDLFQLIPKVCEPKTHSTQGNIDMISVNRLPEFGGGVSVLYIDTVESYKHSSLSAESSDWDFIHYDEPPPHQMFLANKRGLSDRNGKFWVNATPKTELWVNDEFSPEKKPNRVVAESGMRFQRSIEGGDRFIITATTYDNPHNSAEGVAEFASSLNREEKECMLLGLPLNLAGLVHKEFQYDVHVLSKVPDGWKDYHLPPRNYTVRVAWDVHDAIPQAVLFIATAPTGESFVYDEMFFTTDIKENAELLKEKTKDHFVADYLIDPRAVITSPRDGLSILDFLMEFDLYFDLGSKDMNLGLSKTREKLKERRVVNAETPTLSFCPTVATMIWEIMRYAYSPKTMKPVDKDDHMCENLRRLVLTDLMYIEPPKDEDYVRKPQTVSFNELSSPARR